MHVQPRITNHNEVLWEDCVRKAEPLLETKRYPTPGSVRSTCAASPSLWRSWLRLTRGYWRSSTWAGPQIVVSSRPCVTTLPASRARAVSRSHSRGVSAYSAPDTRARRCSRSTSSGPARSIGSGRSASGAAHGGADAVQQLGHAEGLVHVVVGAGIQRRHRLGLAVPRADHDHGDGAEGAPPRERFLSVHVGQTEVEQHAGRRPRCRQPHPFARGLGRQGGETRGQRVLQEALDLRLVIHHQHGGRGAAHAGKRMVSRVPWPSRTGLSAAMRPPIASTRRGRATGQGRCQRRPGRPGARGRRGAWRGRSGGFGRPSMRPRQRRPARSLHARCM